MPRLRRQMSSFMARNLYQIFPATLHYYNPRSVSSLYDSRERGDPTHEMYSEAVYVSKNGLVYPAVGNCLLADPALVCSVNVGTPPRRWLGADNLRLMMASRLQMGPNFAQTHDGCRNSRECTQTKTTTTS